MKLPGIQYDRPVQSLVTASPWSAIRAGQATAESHLAMGRAAEHIGGIISDKMKEAYQAQGASEYQNLWALAQTELAAAKISLTESQYREDEEGNLISRHDEVQEDWASTSNEVMNNILGKSKNSLARQRLQESFMEYGTKSSIEMMETSSDWAKNESHRQTVDAIEQNLAHGRYEDAERAFVSGVASGSLSQREIEEIPRQIIAHQQYGALSSAIPQVESAKDYLTLRQEIAGNVIITEQQRNALGAELDEQIKESLVGATRAVIETRGIMAGEEFIRAINKTPYESLGYTADDPKFGAISRMQSVLQDYRFGLKQSKEDEALLDRMNCIKHGCPADPKSGLDKKAMDTLFQEAIAEEEQPFSEVYMETALSMASTQGWVPETVKSDIRAYMWHDDPSAVTAAATALLELDTISPRSVDEFNENDIAFALMVKEYGLRGVPTEETIKKIREGIERVPRSIKRGREEYYTRSLQRDAEKIIKSQINADPDANPWFKFSSRFPDDMRLEFEAVFKDEYVRTGNENVAAQAAYRIMRNIWGVTDRGGRLSLERNSPEAVLTGGKPEKWLTEQFEVDMKSINLKPKSVGLELNIADPDRSSWIVFDKETQDVVIDDEGNVMVWRPDYSTSKEAERQRKKAEKVRADAEARQQRDVERERARKLHDDGSLNLQEMTPYGTGDGYGDRKAVDAAIATGLSEAAIQTWGFVLEDVPEFWSKYGDYREHVRRTHPIYGTGDK